MSALELHRVPVQEWLVNSTLQGSDSAYRMQRLMAQLLTDTTETFGRDVTVPTF